MGKAAVQTTNKTTLSAEALKSKLWNVMQMVEEGRIDVYSANSIAKLSREILSIAKTEIQATERAGKTTKSVTGFLEIAKT